MDEHPSLTPPAPQLPRRTPLLALVLASGALATLLCFFFFGSALYPSIRSYGQHLSVKTQYGTDWYTVGVGKLVPQHGIPGYDDLPFTVEQAVPFSSTGDVAVLARVPNQPGTVLGVVHKDRSFTPMVRDGIVKYDLVVRPDGLAVYTAAESEPIAATASSTASVGGPLATPVIEYFLRSNMLPLRLKLVDLQRKSAPVDLGTGASPRLTSSGMIVALSDKGLVGIDPVSKTATTLIPLSTRAVMGSISPDGAYVVLPATRGVITYHITSVSPADIDVIGTSETIRFTQTLSLASPTVLYTGGIGTGGVQIYNRAPFGFGSEYFWNLGSIRIPSSPTL